MSSQASASAASSSLSRSRTAVVLVTAAVAVFGIYYFTAAERHGRQSVASVSLTRSNAVRRRNNHPEARDVINHEEPYESHQITNNNDNNESSATTAGDGILPQTLEPQFASRGGADDDYAPTEANDTEPLENGEAQGQNNPRESRAGQNVVSLLFRVSEDATRRNAYVHRGCVCNSCGEMIRGIRYRCVNCIDYDLCEPCEAQGRHTKTHIFYKIRVPTSSAAPRQIQPVWYPGTPESENAQRPLSKDLIARLMKETGMERPELDAMFEIFCFQASEEWREDPDGIRLAMSRKNFEQCLVPSGSDMFAPPSLLHDRMFAFFDTNHDDLISFPEYVNGVAFGRKRDKIDRIFEAYDLDGDGFVDRKDFLRMFRSYYVMQKQRQDEMITGLKDQVMNTQEAQKLVAGGQPLSSVFGNGGDISEGRSRQRGIGAGKRQRPNEEAEIVDEDGVVLKDSKNLGTRDDVFIDDIAFKDADRREALLRQHPGLRPDPTDGYWQATMNPPTTMEQLQSGLLETLIRNRVEGVSVNHWPNIQLISGNLNRDGDVHQESNGSASTNEVEGILASTQNGEGSNSTANQREVPNGGPSSTTSNPFSTDPQEQHQNESLDLHQSQGQSFANGSTLSPDPYSESWDRVRTATPGDRDSVDEFYPEISEKYAPSTAIPAFVEDEDIKAVCGHADRNKVTKEQLPKVSTRARDRIMEPEMPLDLSVSHMIHERWQRRMFYTDEEEGARAPGDWVDEEDFAYTFPGPAYGRCTPTSRSPPSRSPPSRSPPSRSPSKSRFPKEDEEYGARSENSNSQRNIPERWAGFDIPEAEKDVGKEILYQVTQQACNELLDILFKPHEDKAITAMGNRAARDDYRTLFTNKCFEEWALKVDGANTPPSLDLQRREDKKEKQPIRPPAWVTRGSLPEVELGDVRQRPLDQLLAATGYQVEEDHASLVDPTSPQSTTEPGPSIETMLSLENSIPIEDLSDTVSVRSTSPQGVSVEHNSHVEGSSGLDGTQDVDGFLEAIQGLAGIDRPYEFSSISERDSTLPQHRTSQSSLPHDYPTLEITLKSYLTLYMPASEITAAEASGAQELVSIFLPSYRPDWWPANVPYFYNGILPSTAAVEISKKDSYDGIIPNVQEERPCNTTRNRRLRPQFQELKDQAIESMRNEGIEAAELRRFHVADWTTLYELRASEICELEAKERGGWGRLSCKEVETIVKAREKEVAKMDREGIDAKARGPSLDYFGSWIHFCIP